MAACWYIILRKIAARKDERRQFFFLDWEAKGRIGRGEQTILARNKKYAAKINVRSTDVRRSYARRAHVHYSREQ